MNGLSWLIYMAGAFGNLQGIFITFMILSGIAGAISIIAAIICNFDNNLHDQYQPRWVKTLRVSVTVFIVTGILVTLVPSERTVLLIAASQTGEAMLATPAGTEAGDLALDTLKLLREKINDQLSPDTEVK